MVRRTLQARPALTDEQLKNLKAADYARLKLSDDERARLRAIDAEKGARRAEWIARLDIEEQPLLADLRRIGLSLDSVWDLVNMSMPYREALPILMEHLTRPYSDRTMEGIARALAVPDARSAWPLLVTQYRKARTGVEDGIILGAKGGLAAALSATATDDVIDELIGLAKDRSNGSSRVLLLRGLRKSKMPQAKAALDDLASDPDLEKEIASWNKRRKRA
jgi:hypothetical protein